ncbi:MAG: hypothetical protein M3Y89_18070 [Actinomycetota bacterium]|nr:hypothetical protein [Actinomycetota bacterium]
MGDLDITGAHGGGPHMNFEEAKALRGRPGVKGTSTELILLPGFHSVQEVCA